MQWTSECIEHIETWIRGYLQIDCLWAPNSCTTEKSHLSMSGSLLNAIQHLQIECYPAPTDALYLAPSETTCSWGSSVCSLWGHVRWLVSPEEVIHSGHLLPGGEISRPVPVLVATLVWDGSSPVIPREQRREFYNSFCWTTWWRKPCVILMTFIYLYKSGDPGKPSQQLRPNYNVQTLRKI